MVVNAEKARTAGLFHARFRSAGPITPSLCPLVTTLTNDLVPDFYSPNNIRWVAARRPRGKRSGRKLSSGLRRRNVYARVGEGRVADAREGQPLMRRTMSSSSTTRGVPGAGRRRSTPGRRHCAVHKALSNRHSSSSLALSSTSMRTLGH